MKLFVVLSCLAAVAFAAPAEENTLSFWPQPSSRPNGRIINGANAAQGEAPFICSMRWGIINMQHTCGCSLISLGTATTPGWCLTAAHCITELPNLNLARVELQCGVTHRTNDASQHQLRPYDRNADTIIHPGWVPGGVGPDDMALVRINNALPSGLPNIQTIPLRRAGFIDTGVAHLFGWGSITDGSVNANVIPEALQTAQKDLLTDAECRARLAAINPGFVEPLRDTNICAARGNISACGGDSGGPLVVRENNQWVQVGIVSWGISPCGSVPQVPSVYARASAYIDWVTSNTGLTAGNIVV